MARHVYLAALLVILVLITPAICFESCAMDDDANGCPHGLLAIAVDVPGAVRLVGVRCAASPVASSFASPLVADVFHVPLLG